MKMEKLFIVAAFLSLSFSFSQTEAKEVKSALSDFKKAYNDSDYEAIFNLFNDKMKAEYPLKKVEQLYGKINKAKGDIKALSFGKIVEASHIYKAKFKRDVLDLEINVDENNLINTLLIKRAKRNYKRN